MRGNRVDNSPVIRINETKKKNRDVYDYQYDDQNKLLVCRWNGNSVVTVVSNVHRVFPLQKARRWSGVQKMDVEIYQPNVITQYNC